MPPPAAFAFWSYFLFGSFKDSSSIAGTVWYNKDTKQDLVRKTDAAEISADNPTVYLCDTRSEGRGK